MKPSTRPSRAATIRIALLTIIEGCDKSCAYCVVPFTRGPERSRTSASVMSEAQGLAGAGYTESSCWAKTSTAIAIHRPPVGISRRCSTAWTDPGIRRCAYHLSSRDFVKEIIMPSIRIPCSACTCNLPVAVGVHSRAGGDAAALHAAINTCAASSG